MDPEATEIVQTQLADGERLLWTGRQDSRRARVNALRRIAPIYLGMMAFICSFSWQAANSKRQFEAQNAAIYARMVHNDPARIRQQAESDAQMDAAMRAYTPAWALLLRSPLAFPIFASVFFGAFSMIPVAVMVFLARRTLYAVTDRRLLILLAPASNMPTRVEAYGPEDIRFLERQERADGAGDLYFVDRVPGGGKSITQDSASFGFGPMGVTRTVGKIGFEGIANGREVERLAASLRSGTPHKELPIAAPAPSVTTGLNPAAAETGVAVRGVYQGAIPDPTLPYDQPVTKSATVLPIACGTIWLTLIALWMLLFLQQERGKQAIDALITERGRSTTGLLTSAMKHLSSSKGGQDFYDVKYTFTLPSGEKLQESDMIRAEDLSLLVVHDNGRDFNLQPGSISVRYGGRSLGLHAAPITVEYDPQDPAAHHRLQGLSYRRLRQGDLALGIAIGAVIGLVGFFLFTSSLWARWYRQRKGITTYAEANRLKQGSDRVFIGAIGGMFVLIMYGISIKSLLSGPKYYASGDIFALFGTFFLVGILRAFKADRGE